MDFPGVKDNFNGFSGCLQLRARIFRVQTQFQWIFRGASVKDTDFPGVIQYFHGFSGGVLLKIWKPSTPLYGIKMAQAIAIEGIIMLIFLRTTKYIRK